MKSLSQKIEQLEGLIDTKDINSWENDFLTNIVSRFKANGKRTDFFTSKTVEVIERIWNKHFA